MPLVSFIIPIYNLPVALVKECLQSVLFLSLTKEEREIVVIDDGSEISFYDQISEFHNDIIFLRTENQGLGPARNLGLSKASGEYIQFVDGDDALIKEVYDKCIARLRQNHDDILMFRLSRSADKDGDVRFTRPVSGVEFMLKNNLRGAACGYLFRREILGNLRFNNIICEDEEFTPQLILRARTLCDTRSAAYFYRQRSGSIINNTDAQRQRRRFEDILGVIVRLKTLASDSQPAENKALSRRVAQLTMDYIYNQWKYSRKRSAVKEALQQLETLSLYPLPKENYTIKYTFFRHLLKLI